VKSVLGWIGALLPVAYCLGFVYYFQSNFGGFEGAMAIGLGPTMLGLGGIGLLFCLPLVFKIVRLAAGPGKPAPGYEAKAEEEPAFDADAALARYMARKASGEIVPPPAPVEARPTFGRKLA
jgi:hypothetical protein